MKKIRVGIIGAGRNTRVAHLKVLPELSEQVEISAVADIDIHKAKKLARDFTIDCIFEDYNKLLAVENIDAVLISVPNFIHAQIAIEAMNHGKHVLVEKPMAMNCGEAKDILDAVQRTGKTCMVAMNNRFRSDIQFVKDFIQRGQLGDVYHIKCGWLRSNGIPDWGGWFTTRSLSGGGPLIDLGVHMLDLALYVIGDFSPVSVMGAIHTKFGDRKQGKERARVIANQGGVFDVEDYALAFIKLREGKTVTLETSWAANIEKDSVFLEIMGTDAGIRILNDDGVKVFSHTNAQQAFYSPNVKFDYEEARVRMWAHFLNCIRTGITPSSSAEQGLLINKILDAVYESSRTGNQVFL